MLQMPPPTKKQKFEMASIALACEFSECKDVCNGMDEFVSHVALHIYIMKDQLAAAAKDECDGAADVDRTKCECPWRGCGAILDVTDKSNSCSRHINFHGYHTYLKTVGDAELKKREVAIQCQGDESQKNVIPDLPDPFICKWNLCDFEVDNPWVFYRHVENHAIDHRHDKSQSRKCDWAFCKYSCRPNATVTKMKDHLRTHTQERLCACPRCGSLYSMRTRLEDHQKRAASGDKGFQCSHCSKQYVSQRLLKDHLRKHVNMYGCMFCDMTCPSPSALRIHILYRHSTERPFSCAKCDMTLKTKFDLASHNLTHEYKGQIFACSVEFCEYTCQNHGVLRKHMAEVHRGEQRIFGCHLCDNLFTRSMQLSTHLRFDHLIKYPSGHVKFRFAEEDDGIRRLVTVRYECFQDEYEEEGEEEGFAVQNGEEPAHSRSDEVETEGIPQDNVV